MLTYSNRILTILSFSFVIYLMISNIDVRRDDSRSQFETIYPNTEGRIQEIRKEASGKDKIITEKETTLQERLAYSCIDYIMGESFRKKFVKHG